MQDPRRGTTRHTHTHTHSPNKAVNPQVVWVVNVDEGPNCNSQPASSRIERFWNACRLYVLPPLPRTYRTDYVYTVSNTVCMPYHWYVLVEILGALDLFLMKF